MSATQRRQVECLMGPMDGTIVTVASLVKLPDTIVIPVLPHARRAYIYRLVEHTDGFSAYKYDRTEVRG